MWNYSNCCLSTTAILNHNFPSHTVLCTNERLRQQLILPVPHAADMHHIKVEPHWGHSTVSNANLNISARVCSRGSLIRRGIPIPAEHTHTHTRNHWYYSLTCGTILNTHKRFTSFKYGPCSPRTR